jgi:hypothetical protein
VPLFADLGKGDSDVAWPGGSDLSAEPACCELYAWATKIMDHREGNGKNKWMLVIIIWPNQPGNRIQPTTAHRRVGKGKTNTLTNLA